MSIELNNQHGEIEDFAKMLEETPEGSADIIGKVIKGSVISMDKESALIDVGLKSEGRVSLKEFATPGRDLTLKIGDRVEVYVEKMEDRDGLIVLSHEKARREASWQELERAHKTNQTVNGIIFGRVKGGFTVDLNGAVAFLPASQLDVRPIKDITPFMGKEQPFQILKMDRSRGNIVVSRRTLIEESRTEARSELLANIEEGKILEGVVKNITDYGAFVDLGGLDGLLHVTDMSWRRITHPSEVLHVGQTIKVQIIRYNRDTQRISLGIKQLESDPWQTVGSKFSVGMKLRGTVTNIADYGAFVELDSGIEGLVHVSEMSWTKKNVHPGKIISTSQEIEVMVLEIDPAKRRIALGIKQCMENPWSMVASDRPVGSEFEGEVRNITEFGLFIAVSDDLDGMVHMSDLSWTDSPEEAIRKYNKGDKIRVKVLEVDPEKERISLGVKQLSPDPYASGLAEIKKGDIVTCDITGITDQGLDVAINGTLPGFIRKAELSKERSEQRTDRFAIGEKVDAKVTNIDRTTRKLSLSIKGREIHEEKEAMATYGSADSGASLGDILGAAFDKVKENKQTAKTDNSEKE
ncbi:30S ribosomal protein S1 [Caedimonas varicaedens]|jgi:small subunit ribosomal protein S1|uniref:30S ribosomal protein S1 n=1 Tax=Caedimonas varicaedens TaxID=1629334 RepID=A0A0K8MEJ5_9PROT|nr:30S ribosomal protein S1 [Caedimonas varicaedens]